MKALNAMDLLVAALQAKLATEVKMRGTLSRRWTRQAETPLQVA